MFKSFDHLINKKYVQNMYAVRILYKINIFTILEEEVEAPQASSRSMCLLEQFEGTFVILHDSFAVIYMAYF